MFKHCLICTDGADGLYRLARFVPDLARTGLTKIVFHHSIPVWEQNKVTKVDQHQIAAATQQLELALKAIPQGVEVKIEVLSGCPTDTIPHLVVSEEIEVVIIGHSVHSALEETIFGSTSSALAKLTTVPLMLFRPQLIYTYTGEELALRCQHLWRSLLIPYNGTEVSDYVISKIKAYVDRDLNTKNLQMCKLLWVIEDKSRDEVLHANRIQQAQIRLEQVKTEISSLGVDCSWELRFGSPPQQILAAAIEHDISAIALGTEKRTNILEWTVPSAANEVLRQNWFPLLLFSPKQ